MWQNESEGREDRRSEKFCKKLSISRLSICCISVLFLDVLRMFPLSMCCVCFLSMFCASFLSMCCICFLWRCVAYLIFRCAAHVLFQCVAYVFSFYVLHIFSFAMCSVSHLSIMTWSISFCLVIVFNVCHHPGPQVPVPQRLRVCVVWPFPGSRNNTVTVKLIRVTVLPWQWGRGAPIVTVPWQWELAPSRQVNSCRHPGTRSSLRTLKVCLGPRSVFLGNLSNATHSQPEFIRICFSPLFFSFFSFFHSFSLHQTWGVRFSCPVCPKKKMGCYWKLMVGISRGLGAQRGSRKGSRSPGTVG